MGSIRRRLSRLEEQEPGWGYREELLIDRALAQLPCEDVVRLSEYLDRNGEPTEAETAVLHRLEERLEEVQWGA